MSKKTFSRRNLLEKKLHEESSIVANDSMAVLKEFEVFEEDLSREESSEKDHGGKEDE